MAPDTGTFEEAASESGHINLISRVRNLPAELYNIHPCVPYQDRYWAFKRHHSETVRASARRRRERELVKILFAFDGTLGERLLRMEDRKLGPALCTKVEFTVGTNEPMYEIWWRVEHCTLGGTLNFLATELKRMAEEESSISLIQ
nr:hypothetical protein B0A51_04821 [Rachicladosporium sp. CCFEE 5018]